MREGGREGGKRGALELGYIMYYTHMYMVLWDNVCISVNCYLCYHGNTPWWAAEHQVWRWVPPLVRSWWEAWTQREVVPAWSPWYGWSVTTSKQTQQRHNFWQHFRKWVSHSNTKSIHCYAVILTSYHGRSKNKSIWYDIYFSSSLGMRLAVIYVLGWSIHSWTFCPNNLSSHT